MKGKSFAIYCNLCCRVTFCPAAVSLLQRQSDGGMKLAATAGGSWGPQRVVRNPGGRPVCLLLRNMKVAYDLSEK